MTITNLPEDRARARVQSLLDQITVTSIETGKPLSEIAKRGRIFAACRGYENTLVTINWGPTSPDAVRKALDTLREAE